jgi:uroporphyrinogen-III synthase
MVTKKPDPTPKSDTKEAQQLASKVMIRVGRELRQRQTEAETLLWERIRDRRLEGIKFRRQYAIPNTSYVADFFCHECGLVIELDGPIHEGQKQSDILRQEHIESLGYHVSRFSNELVFNDLKSVLAAILLAHRGLLHTP